MEKRRRRMATNEMVGTSDWWVCRFFFKVPKSDTGWNIHFSWNWLELPETSLNSTRCGMGGITYDIELHASTRYFDYTSWNETKWITFTNAMLTIFSINKIHKCYVNNIFIIL